MNGYLLTVLCTCYLGQAWFLEAVLIDQTDVGGDGASPASFGLLPLNPNGRRKRETVCQGTSLMSSGERAEILDSHNYFRALEQASNMLKVVWDEDLANMAQFVSNQCTTTHNLCGSSMGQNLDVNFDNTPDVNVTRSVLKWMDERENWDFTNQTCRAGVCGHWAQLVTAKIGRVGCAYSRCPTAYVWGVTLNNISTLICNYRPGLMMPMYRSGAPCSECGTVITDKGFKCENDLCVPCLPKDDPQCKCGEALICQNGGTYSTDTCICQCPIGFGGIQCERCGDPLTCQNGGNYSYWACNCRCPFGFTGALCEKCSPAFACKNGGTYSTESCGCQCPSRFTGVKCEKCAQVLDCQNGGTYSWNCFCYCRLGFAGDLCEKCGDPLTCQNGGTYTPETCGCQCPSRFTGLQCEKCSEVLSCQNGGTYSTSACVCRCVFGFTGDLCEKCDASVTCQQGGTYSAETCTCKCPAGFYGLQCEKSCTCADVWRPADCAVYCGDPRYLWFLMENCAKTCNLCQTPDVCLT